MEIGSQALLELLSTGGAFSIVFLAFFVTITVFGKIMSSVANGTTGNISGLIFVASLIDTIALYIVKG